jgi:predicted esterase
MEQFIEISRQARVFVQGEFDSSTKRIWIALHGYGQLVPFFSRKFRNLNLNTNLLIFPEGTHRYYLQGQEGRVGASWMTKEIRECDISDNHAYLDQVYEQYVPNDFSGEVIVLGFSQGAATATRWATSTEKTLDRLILWASVFPPDLEIPSSLEKINKLKPLLVIGDQDEYYSAEAWRGALAPWIRSEVRYEEMSYSGGHDIQPQVLEELIRRLS